eukprot:TRINITY_DN26960_c0_g1_i1.p1 TRINITY_DN26960_c0_g1~~TRINITY_DN26960_c0_g1_i1.p1  ORF type:complete len:641 (+),score=95.03 TRINITY_DN26960_c0_g1_i1:126-1925(+)
MPSSASSRTRSLPPAVACGANARVETAPDLEEVNACIEKRLFVGRVPVGTTESDLQRMFSVFGRVTECKLVRGGRICFIGYATWAECHSALINVDGRLSVPSQPGTSPLVVSFAERTRSVGHGGGSHLAKAQQNSRVFVGSLPEFTTDIELRELCETYGKVQAANLLPAKSHRRCGFVNFSLWGEALDAIENLDGSTYPPDSRDGTTITVVLAEPRAGDDGSTLPAPVAVPGFGNAPLAPPIAACTALKKRRAEIQGASTDIAMSSSVSSAELEDMRCEYEDLKARYLQSLDGVGTEQDCTMVHWSLMKLRAVIYSNKGQVNTAAKLVVNGRLPPAGINVKSGVRVQSGRRTPAGLPVLNDGRPVTSPVTPKLNTSQPAIMDDRDAARLFIGGLPFECSVEELRGLVDQIPFDCPPEDSEILECRVLPGRGIGFLRFAAWNAAEKCLDELNHRRVNGWPQPLRCQWASPKAGAETSASIGGVEDSFKEHDREESGGRRRSRSRGRSRNDRSFSDGDENSSTHRLFVGQLLRGIDRNDFMKVFEPFGTVDECKFLEDKGVGYVTFAQSSSAKRAIEELNESEVPGISRGGGLNVRYAKRR